MNGPTATVTEKGIIKLLDATLLMQRYNILHIADLPKTFKNRPMTFPSFTTLVAGLRRLWYLQSRGKLPIPPSLEFAIGERKCEASELLPPSKKTIAVGWAETVFLIKALPRGSNDWLDNAFIMTAQCDVAKRIGVWDHLVLGDIVKVEKAPSSGLVRVVIHGGSSKKQLAASINAITLTGSITNIDDETNGSVFYLDQSLKFKHGIGLIDKTGVTIVQKMQTQQFCHLLNEPLYLKGRVNGVSAMYKEAQDNTTIPQSVPLRPHGTRTHMYDEVTKAMQSGKLSAANKNALQMTMSHSDNSTRGRQVYMRELVESRINFAALWSPNKDVANAGVHQPTPFDLKTRLGLTFEPDLRYLPDKRNLDILYTIVKDQVLVNDEKGRNNVWTPGETGRQKEYERERVDANVKKILLAFGRMTQPRIAAHMNDNELVEYVKECLVKTFSSAMTRMQMTVFVYSKLLIYL